MFEWFKKTNVAAKAFTLSGIGLLLSFGLCGTIFASAGLRSSNAVGYFAGFGIIFLALGILGIIVGTILAIILSLRN